MDEYGGYLANKDDWDKLATLFLEKENIVFPYSKDRKGSMIVSINREFNTSGTMPFGGNPRGHAYIGILRRGFDHIDINKEQHASYLVEHLSLMKDEGIALAELLNELRKRRQ